VKGRETAAHLWAIYTHILSLGVVGTARSRDYSSVLSVDLWFMNHCWDGVETTTSPELWFTRDSLLSTPTIPTPRGPPTGTHRRFPIVFSGTGSPTRCHRPLEKEIWLASIRGSPNTTIYSGWQSLLNLAHRMHMRRRIYS
jgi:hypothetical protein